MFRVRARVAVRRHEAGLPGHCCSPRSGGTQHGAGKKQMIDWFHFFFFLLYFNDTHHIVMTFMVPPI